MLLFQRLASDSLVPGALAAGSVASQASGERLVAFDAALPVAALGGMKRRLQPQTHLHVRHPYFDCFWSRSRVRVRLGSLPLSEWSVAAGIVFAKAKPRKTGGCPDVVMEGGAGA